MAKSGFEDFIITVDSAQVPYRIELEDSFRVVGYLIQTTNKNGEGRKSIPRHWSKLMKSMANRDIL